MSEPQKRISLCNLCVLCVSVVWFYSEFINHRGHRGCTEKNAILCLCLFVADKFEG